MKLYSSAATGAAVVSSELIIASDEEFCSSDEQEIGDSDDESGTSPKLDEESGTSPVLDDPTSTSARSMRAGMAVVDSIISGTGVSAKVVVSDSMISWAGAIVSSSESARAAISVVSSIGSAITSSATGSSWA